MNVLISACLLGFACRYDGQRKEYSAVEELPEGERHSPHSLLSRAGRRTGYAARSGGTAGRCSSDAKRPRRDRAVSPRRGDGFKSGADLRLHCRRAERKKPVLRQRPDLRRHVYADADGWRRRDGGAAEETRHYRHRRKPDQSLFGKSRWKIRAVNSRGYFTETPRFFTIGEGA